VLAQQEVPQVVQQGGRRRQGIAAGAARQVGALQGVLQLRHRAVVEAASGALHVRQQEVRLVRGRAGR
jgi:DNA-binding transcriptional regulator YbjK